MVSEFSGFSEKTVEMLLDIRFNNSKEFFHANKERYQEFVHRPIEIFSAALFEKMQEMDGEFNDKPKVSRALRDTRFSKNKLPYKENKWVIFRQNQSPHIQHERPNFYFEISPEGYRYGLGFWPSPKGMKNFREHAKNRLLELDRIIEISLNQKAFELSGDFYKKPQIPELTQKQSLFLQRKNISLGTEYLSDNAMYGSELLHKVFEDFKEVYPVYKFINQSVID